VDVVKKKAQTFFRKYFLEGQKLNNNQVEALAKLGPDAPWHQRVLVKHRRLIGILIPFLFFQISWWLLAYRWNLWTLFPERWILSVTMIFGASVAGMTAAAFTIFWMQIKLEWHSILLCSLGGFFGMVLGLEVLDDMLDPPTKKLGFVCIWFSFAFALFLLNRQHKRRTFDSVPNFGIWQGIVLTLTGFLGGIFSAITGSGVDICSFSILSLLFRVSEKVSTPTSVVLMAINTCIGFFWRQLMTETGCEPEAWKFLAVCVPIVVFFAPFGSMLSSHLHRQVLAALIYILDTVALITAFIVIPITTNRGILVGCLISGGFVFFLIISYVGQKLLANIESKMQEQTADTEMNHTHI